jgi:hypothetical protein
MAYEKLTDLGTDKVFALGKGEDKIDSVEGYYLGSRQVTTGNGPSTIHVFQTVEGNIGVWGTKKLNDNLGNSVRGCMMLINYKGKVKLQGGKTQHTYEFNIDRGQTIPVSAGEQANAEFAAADTGDDSTYSDDVQEVSAADLAAAKRAKAEEILARAKKGKTN